MADEWALHNTLKGWTLYGLSVREVQLMTQVMSVNEVKLVKVCQKKSSSWQPLSQQSYPDFFIKNNHAIDDYPLLPSDRGTVTHADGESDTDYFVIKPRTILPRLHKRHDIAIPCTIFSTKQNFKTESINISEGGLQFKDLLPDWIAGYFIVGLACPDGMIQLMCSLVEDQKEKKRVQIVSEDSDPQFLIYKSWLGSL